MDLQAALGRIQLEKLRRFLAQRDTLAGVYDEQLATLPCTLPPSQKGRIYYRYVISIQGNIPKLIQVILNIGIKVARPVYRPLHRYFDLKGYPGAEMAWKSHLSLPIHPTVTSEDVHRMCYALQQAFKENS